MLKCHVPRQLLEEIVCESCGKYLSIFPIHLSREGKGGVCGRCPHKRGFSRDQAFECLTQHLLFPCCNDKYGCKKSLTPAELPAHEDNCEYKPNQCVLEICQWTGAQCSIMKHLESDHTDMVRTEKCFEIQFFDSAEDTFLIKHNQEYFLAHWDYEIMTREFKMSIKHVKTSTNKYVYRLKFEAGPKSHKTAIKSTETQENFMDVSLDTLQAQLNNPKAVWVYVNIGFVEDLKDHDADNVRVDMELLTLLECEICNQLLKPPVYLCTGGHSICEHCRQNVNESCPFCRKRMTDSRNYTLEKVIRNLSYQCKYHVHGCKYYGPAENVQEHVSSCSFKNY